MIYICIQKGTKSKRIECINERRDDRIRFLCSYHIAVVWSRFASLCLRCNTDMLGCNFILMLLMLMFQFEYAYFHSITCCCFYLQDNTLIEAFIPIGEILEESIFTSLTWGDFFSPASSTFDHDTFSYVIHYSSPVTASEMGGLCFDS